MRIFRGLFYGVILALAFYMGQPLEAALPQQAPQQSPSQVVQLSPALWPTVTWHINKNPGFPGCFNFQSPFCTIQDAITQAAQSQQKYFKFIIHGGPYQENVDLRHPQIQGIEDKSFILQGDGIDNTVIDGGGNESVIMAHKVSLTLRDLTITNGDTKSTNGTWGGGIMMGNGALLIENVKITGNKANHGGGGIRNSSATLTIKNSIISDNTAGQATGNWYSAGHFAVSNQ